MDLAELIDGLPVRVARGATAGVRVCDVTEDSRTAVPGSLFIARSGAEFDGRRFIEPAIECGAVAVLTDDAGVELPAFSAVALLVTDDVAAAGAVIAERFYGQPSSELTLVGITGTNGKTTTAHIVHQLLNSAGLRCGVIGTVEIDDGREVAGASMTTPPAVELSRTLATMVENGCAAAVMEVSSHGLATGRVAGLSFDIGVFTNLTGDHLDFHGDMETYAAVKRSLMDRLGDDGASVVNADDQRAAFMTGPNPRRCTAGGADDCGWRVEVTAATLAGLAVRVRGPEFVIEAQTALIGDHNAMNVLEAVATADEVLTLAGFDLARRESALAAGLEGVKPPAGRLERVSGRHDEITVFVDFAHTDGALESTLGAVGRLVPEGRRLWVVFGCGGHKDKAKRPRMGRVAATHADRVIITSDNPRTEPPMGIIDEALAGVPEDRRGCVSTCADRELAIREALEGADPGDVVVLAGKGHETEQEVASAEGGTRMIRFDDREVARRLLREVRLTAGAARGGGA